MVTSAQRWTAGSLAAASVVLLVLLFLPCALFAQSRISEPLQRYEDELGRMCRDGTASEQVGALEALASVGSPAFEHCLEQVGEVQDEELLARACKAVASMPGVGDRALPLVVRALRSLDARVVAEGIRALPSIPAGVPLRAVWEPDRPLVLWADAIRNAALPVNRITGVDEARPWADPVWEGLPITTRASLLARAGSPEALERLSGELASSRVAWLRIEKTAAEPGPRVDVAGLLELAGSDDASFRVYAARSLAARDDAGLLRTLIASPHDKVLAIAAQAVAESPRHEVSALAVELCLGLEPGRAASVCGLPQVALLDEEDLLELVLGDPEQWLLLVQHELLRRGRPLSRAQVDGEQPLPNGRTLGWPDPRSLTRLLVEVRCLVRERDTRRLTKLVERAVGDEGMGAVVDAFLGAAARSPSMMLDLGERRRCRLQRALEGWYQLGCPADASASFEVRRCSRRLAGLVALASPAQRRAGWTAWLSGPDPLSDQERLLRLAAGRDVYAAATRTMIGSGAGPRWLPKTTREVLSAQRSLELPERWWGCAAAGPPLGRTSSELPPPAVIEARQRLVEDLRSAYGGLNPARLSADLVLARTGGEAFTRGRLEQLADHGPSTALRTHAGQLLRQMCDGCDTLDLGSGLWRADEAGPPLDELLDELAPRLDRARAAYLDSLVEELRRPKELSVGCSWGMVEPKPRWTSSGSFFTSKVGEDMLPQLRSLLDSDDALVRRQAELAVWEMDRDPAMPARWRRELEAAPESRQAASLLTRLIHAHRPGDAMLIAGFLSSSAPDVRVRALDGIEAYRLTGLKPLVVRSLADAQVEVAEKAVRVLALWEGRRAASLLVDLVMADDRRTAHAAAHALGRLHDGASIDLMMDRAARSGELSQQVAHRLSQAVWRASLGLAVIDRTSGDSAGDPRQRLAAMQPWWAAVRRGDGHGWIRPAVERLVAGVDPSCNETGGLRLGAFFGSDWRNTYYLRAHLGSLTTWLRAVPEDDLWHLVNHPWREEVSTAIFNPSSLDPSRSLEVALKGLSQASSRHRILDTLDYYLAVTMTGEDCGNPSRASCASRIAISRCWYGLAEALDTPGPKTSAPETSAPKASARETER